VKEGIILMAELVGPVADRIHEIQEQYDPRMAAELPPHITLTGSSGMGPIPPSVTTDELRRALEPVARETAPMSIRFQAPMKFMQSVVVVLPVDPYGPIRMLHDRIKSSGLRAESPRFAFTPHCTLSFYPELSREKLRSLLATRIDEPVTIGSIAAYKTVTISRSESILELPLTGT
jgi:2'-5' RNA ligase